MGDEFARYINATKRAKCAIHKPDIAERLMSLRNKPPPELPLIAPAVIPRLLLLAWHVVLSLCKYTINVNELQYCSFNYSFVYAANNNTGNF